MSPVAICDLPGTELADALIFPWIFPDNVWLSLAGSAVRAAAIAKCGLFEVEDGEKDGGKAESEGLGAGQANGRLAAGLGRSKVQRLSLESATSWDAAAGGGLASLHRRLVS